MTLVPWPHYGVDWANRLDTRMKCTGTCCPGFPKMHRPGKKNRYI